MIGCWTKLVPTRFSNSSKAVSKSNFSSGGGLLDMALKEEERRCCNRASHEAENSPDTEGLMDDRRASWKKQWANHGASSS